MERLLVIFIAGAVGTGLYFWFTRIVHKQATKDFILSNQWLMHPNAICYWRTLMAFVGFGMYFFFDMQAVGIFVFTFAAILDGVDGVVARACDLGTEWGEWLDPMCDKLTYLPAMVGFAYLDIISMKLVLILVAVELAGQFLARHVLSLFKISGAANNFGKIKAIICFALVIFCALLEKNPQILHMGDEVLTACIILSSASLVFKFIPNRLYADILSTLNFVCGVTSLVLSHNGYFAWAICVIIMGQLFDLFDGRMALKHGGTRFGPYLDDIADFVSFGLAPAYVVIVKSGGTLAWVFGGIFVVAVGYRLIRFITVDKKRTDLPDGIFNGLPSPAGALVVLGAALVVPAHYLGWVAIFSAALMISHIRFAHFGRVILETMPKPLFFVMSAAITVTIAYIFKTKNIEMFGFLILASVFIYMVGGRKWLPKAS